MNENYPRLFLTKISYMLGLEAILIYNNPRNYSNI
jgi:hypothetical protein